MTPSRPGASRRTLIARRAADRDDGERQHCDGATVTAAAATASIRASAEACSTLLGDAARRRGPAPPVDHHGERARARATASARALARNRRAASARPCREPRSCAARRYHGSPSGAGARRPAPAPGDRVPHGARSDASKAVSRKVRQVGANMVIGLERARRVRQERSTAVALPARSPRASRRPARRIEWRRMRVGAGG